MFSEEDKRLLESGVNRDIDQLIIISKQKRLVKMDKNILEII
jgi:hypothetical protein